MQSKREAKTMQTKKTIAKRVQGELVSASKYHLFPKK
jgi:hypothetical protein